MEMHNVALSDKDIQIIMQMIAWGQLEIARQMKRLTAADWDIKEYYWFYRCGSNDIIDRLKQIRGY